MPKLIIDKATLDKIANVMGDRPIIMGPDGNMLAPGVVDLLEAHDGPPRWSPNDDRTRMLVLAVEACRDVLFYREQAIDAKLRQRAIRSMTVPICKLMDVVVALMSKMSDQASRAVRDQWSLADQQTYEHVGRRLKKEHSKGTVRRVRNKLGAHLDADVFTMPGLRIELKDVLGALGDCVVLLTLSMNYPSRWFSWIRGLGLSPDGTQRAVETMYEYPLCVRWITDLDGHVTHMGPAILAEDPRHELRGHVFDAAYAYNQVVHETGTSLPFITMHETSGPPLADPITKEVGVKPAEPELPQATDEVPKTPA
jgi:hypothetical protein